MWTEVSISFFTIALELTVLFVVISFIIQILQRFIPYEKVERYLQGKNTWIGVLMALLFAFVTPFCSCSTIPVVVNLLSKRIRFAIVMIFLFSSPVLDPTIITLMAAMLGIKVAIAFTIITSVLSVIIGFTLEKLGFETHVKQVVIKGYEEKKRDVSFRGAMREVMQMMKTVYPFLLIGAAIGSVIHEAVPSVWITAYLGGDNWWLVPVAAVIGIPLYIRLSTMIPISQIMIAKGMALGPVMALMISSAGASLPELTMLTAIFKKRLVAAFVVSVFTMSTISGLLFYII